MAAISKVWRQFENPTPSSDAYLLEEQFCKFHPDTIRNDGALGFLKRLPQQEQEEQDE